jgi:hypothetical protein
LFEFVIRSNETWKKYFPNQADWQTGKQAGWRVKATKQRVMKTTTTKREATGIDLKTL